jgi:hypothetical protein
MEFVHASKFSLRLWGMASVRHLRFGPLNQKSNFLAQSVKHLSMALQEKCWIICESGRTIFGFYPCMFLFPMHAILIFEAWSRHYILPLVYLDLCGSFSPRPLFVWLRQSFLSQLP